MNVRIGFDVDDTVASLGPLLQAMEGAGAEGGEVGLDLLDTSFLGPMSVVCLSLAARAWRAQGCVVHAKPPALRRVAAYAEFSGLAHELGFGPPAVDGHPQNVTMPVRFFSTRDNDSILRVGRLIRRFVDMSSDTADVLNVLIAELVQNVADHAGAEGAIAARVYAKRREVRVAVADRGVGLRATLSTHHAVPDDRAALHLALQAGASARSSLHNAGLGLDLLDDLLHSNGGSLLIASGRAAYTRNAGRTRRRVLSAPCAGTLCVMRFRIDDELYGSQASSEDLWS
ncbi:MAG: hypothetical protein H6732_12700 [Alphaproteobacteria bacterium]|nr:hypothetical protein [Alphaproteobacteria bacterium]